MLFLRHKILNLGRLRRNPVEGGRQAALDVGLRGQFHDLVLQHLLARSGNSGERADGRVQRQSDDDGYQAYRHLGRRLRCSAHLIRKCQGLIDSTDAKVVAAGKGMHEVLHTLMGAIYAARAAPGQEGGALAIRHAADIERLRETVCAPSRLPQRQAARACTRIPSRLGRHSAPSRRAGSAPDQQCRRTSFASLGDRAPHQHGHPQRSGNACVRVAR